MKNVTDIGLIENQVSKNAVFILFGGEACNVCKNIRPQLTAMLEQNFPDIRSVYVDCEVSPEICAQYGVFSLPVMKVYIEGMLIAEEVGAFSIRQLMQALERPYSMWKTSG